MTLAQTAPVSRFDATGYGERLDELARRHSVPAASLAVYAGGELAELAVGVLNRRTGTPASTDAVFQIGSITKVWTAALLLRLTEIAGVDLDALVLDAIPELRLPDHREQALSIRQLLNHTSGLPGDWFPDTGRGDDCLRLLVPKLADAQLAHPLGAMMSYSNSAFSLAGHVAERVLNATWDDALREHVIRPLQLTSSVTLPEDALLHAAAVGHLGTGSEQTVAPIWQLPRACGPAGLVTATARDVASFGAIFLAGAVNEAISPGSIAAMTTPTIPIPGQPAAGVGLGWLIGDWSGRTVLSHDGGTIGQAAALRVLPEEGIVVALLTNGGEWGSFRDAVLGDVLTGLTGTPPPPPPSPDADPIAIDPRPYCGSFARAGVVITVKADEAGDGLRGDVLITDELEAMATSVEQALEIAATKQPATFLAKPAGASAGWMPLAFLPADATGSDGYVYLHFGARVMARIN